MELVAIFLLVVLVYGAGWIWRNLRDSFGEARRANWRSRVYGQVASRRSVRRGIGDEELRQLRRHYGAAANLYHGEVHDRVPFESPKVSFLHQTSRALLSIYESSDHPPHFYTQMTFTIGPGWEHRIEVFPQRFQDSDIRYRNVEDILIGDPHFDRRYVIKANHPEFVPTFLDEGAKQAIEDLRHLLGNDRVLLSINASRILIRKYGLILEIDDLTAFIDLSCRLHDRVFFFWQKQTGIEIMGEADEAGPPVCQVCGEEIPAESRVFCRRCKTPHHADCWEYNGTCSTYACGETRFVARY